MGGPGPDLGTQRGNLPGSLRTSRRRHLNARMIVNGEGTPSMQVDLLVIGLGYVGLPLVREATNVGLSVVGYAIGQGVVDSPNSGRSHVDDISGEDVAAMVAAGFRATTREQEIGEPATV